MPDRILRQGIRKSRATAANILDGGWMAGVFFDWLLTVVDDFGRYEADPDLLRVEMFPFLLDTVRTSHVDRCLASCEASCLIRRYETNGKHFLVVMKVDRPRAKRSRFAQPPAGIECWRGFGDKKQVFASDLRAEEDTCAQTRANVPYSYSYSDAHSDSVSEPPTAKKGRLNAKKAEPSSKAPVTSKPRDGTDPTLDAIHGLPPIPDRLNTARFQTAWTEWVQYCAQRTKPIQPITARKLLQRFVEMGEAAAIRAIDYSIGQGYAGVVEPKNGTDDSPRKPARMTSNIEINA